MVVSFVLRGWVEDGRANCALSRARARAAAACVPLPKVGGVLLAGCALVAFKVFNARRAKQHDTAMAAMNSNSTGGGIDYDILRPLFICLSWSFLIPRTISSLPLAVSLSLPPCLSPSASVFSLHFPVSCDLVIWSRTHAPFAVLVASLFFFLLSLPAPLSPSFVVLTLNATSSTTHTHTHTHTHTL